jgi:hypothetical protein
MLADGAKSENIFVARRRRMGTNTRDSANFPTSTTEIDFPFVNGPSYHVIKTRC